MCRSCAGRHPTRREPCAFCGRHKIAAGRTSAGAECSTCRHRRLGSQITCERCGRDARPSAGTPRACERCAGERVAQVCGSCGAEEQNYSKGRCGTCSLRDRVEQFASAGEPQTVELLRPYLNELAASPKPHSTLNWITTSRTFPILEQLITGRLPVTHEALDSIGPAHTTRFLRQKLVKHGVLPERSEPVTALSALIERQALRVKESQDRTHLRTFATWKVQHDLARKQRQGTATRHADLRARATVRVAGDFLAWLGERQLTLASVQQMHLDRWLADGADHRKLLRAFISWTTKHRITSRVEVRPPAVRRHADPLDPNRRRELLRTLLTGEHLDLRDRVAGLLILLFSQRISHLVLLTTTDVLHRDEQTLLAIGRDPLQLPEPIATLVRQLKHDNDTGWLFYGGRDGNHLSEVYMRERLTRIGIKALPARAAATSNLARHVPAAILADLLGFADITTERWTKQAAGDWTRYAAHRPEPTTPTDPTRSAGDPHSPVALRAPAS